MACVHRLPSSFEATSTTQLLTLGPNPQTQDIEILFPNMLRTAQRAQKRREDHFQQHLRDAFNHEPK